jgi:TRAP transporter 4TM/12TM fusion protein
MPDEPLADETARSRSLKGPLGGFAAILLIAIPVAGIIFLLDVPERFGWLIFPEQSAGLVLGFVLCAAFLMIPEGRNGHQDRVPWYDILAATAGLAIGLYLFIVYPKIANSIGEIYPVRVILGCLTVILLAEACRRLVGWPLVIIVGCFISYALFADYFPGQFYGRPVSVSRLSTYLFLDTNGILGFPIKVAVTTVLVFVIFGQTLYCTGGAAFLSDFALAAVGRFRGGPAKISIVSSSLFGNISGSAVANVVVDGAFTIPMMKRAGYSAPVAAAIEAVASTGGQIMPPVMGAAAFLIAEYLQIPYATVALAALVPAVLYYVALFIEVDLLAARDGIHGLTRDERPKLFPIMRRSANFVVPLAVLVGWMFFLKRQPEEAGLVAVVAGLFTGFLTPNLKLGAREIKEILLITGRGLLDITVTTGLAGVVIGILQLTGLGFSLTFVMLTLGQASVFLLLVLTAIVSIILGMGLPTTAVYILLAVLVAPGLAQMGIMPLAAHLFIFYFGMLSMITPPVCLAAYAAASIGKTDPMRTGWEGMRLCAIAYVVPFLFVFSPALLLMGRWYEVVLSVSTAIVGAVLLGVGLVGYLFRLIGPMRRILFTIAAVGLLIPIVDSGHHAVLTWASNSIGLILGIFLVSLEWLARSHATQRPTVITESIESSINAGPTGGGIP